MAGDWDSPDLTGLLTVFAAHAAELVPPWLQRLRRLAVRPQPPDDLQTVAGARRNVGRHYDLSNGLFALFLDETMTYSPAIFATGPDGTPVAGDLATAQRRKIDRLLDRAGVGPGCRVLEVGTGWGELAIRAARRGATVRTITISREQQELAARRVAEAGLAGRLPSVAAIGDSLARTTLRITGREDFGAHYAETLRIWRERFGAQAARVACLGFDEVFSRMWTFYLCYSEAGFRAGYIDVSQLTLARI